MLSEALTDPDRLAALARTGAMDSGPEDAFDRLTRLASRLLNAPVALVSLVDAERQYFKSELGLGLRETPLSHSFCQQVVLSQEPLVVTDARADPRVAGNPAIEELGVIAYAGVPLTDRNGHTLGSFCVIENRPRQWAEADLSLLRDLARGVVSELELTALNRALAASERQTRAIIDTAHDAFLAVGANGAILDWNPAAERLLGWSRDQALGRPVTDLLPVEQRELTPGLAWNPATGLPEGIEGAVTLAARNRGGRRLTVQAEIAQVTSPGGPVWNMFLRDVTELMASELARSVAEEQLRVTVDHAPIGVALVELASGAHGQILSLNDAFRDLIGDRRSTMAPASLAAMVHPDDVEGLDHELSALAEGKLLRAECELRCRHRDGQIIWLLLTAATVPGDGEMVRAVVHALDIGERKRLEGQLQYLADHDALTGLFNRRRFEEELGRAMARVNRYPSRGSVLLVDLDGFKYVNDSMGHAIGDELVIRVGALMRESLRGTDVIARLGGDEFAVIVTNADAAEAMLVAEKLLETVQARAIALGDDRYARVTASVGITTFDGASGLTPGEVMVEADVAMYQAKERGKNTAVAFVRDPDQRTGLNSQPWLERLKDAIEARSFELLAQPIRGICANGVDRFELLLRLRGQEGELINPGTFLYIAERFDLVQQIDRWVFAEAVALLRSAHAAGNDISLSVNMSGKTLGDPAILDDITELLTATPVPPDQLVVEVTETAAIVNIDRAKLVARGLRALGCGFALDDFGAGFASFYYLKHLEFDYLKIDGEFVRSLMNNPIDQLVIRSVVEIAKAMGAQTVAEFVGDQATLDRLRELGVDYGQGFHLGAAGPLSEMLAVNRAGAS